MINDTRLYSCILSWIKFSSKQSLRWRDVEELGCSSEHGKVLRCFCTVERSSIRRSRAYARAHVYVYVCVFFYSWSLSPSIPPASVTAVERDGDALFPPPSRSFHLFRSRHCMPRGDELSLSTFSIYLPPTASLFLPTSLSVTLALHGRSERWTNRLDVISTYPRIHV